MKRRTSRQAGRLLLAGLSVAVLLLVSVPAPTSAAVAGSTLTTSPVTATLTADPGTAVKTDMQVQNNSAVAATISVKLEKFKAEGTTGQAQLITPDPNDPSLSWVHFSKTSFIAQPGVWTTVTMSVDVPKTAAFGYYYAVVFSPVASSIPQGANALRGANAVLVLLHVRTPGEKNELRISRFSVGQGVYQYLPALFSVDVQNTGDIFTAPRGTIYISRSVGGKIIDTIDVNQGLGNVLPATKRTFQVSWDNGFPAYITKRINGQVVSDKDGKPVQELQWDFSKLTSLRLGRYTAHIVLVYNNGIYDVPLQADVTFWVIPWVPLVILLILLALIAAGVVAIVRGIIRPSVRHIRLR